MFDSYFMRYTALPLLLFVVLMVGISGALQHTLIVYKMGGSYAHWAVVLLALPVFIGLLMRYLDIDYPLVIALIGALVSTAALYYLYKTYFWAEAPSLLDALFLFAVIAGGAHLPFSRGPIERFFGLLLAIVKPNKKKKPAKKGKAAPARNTRQPAPAAAGGRSAIPMIEMLVGITSLALSVYSIAFMGQA